MVVFKSKVDYRKAQRKIQKTKLAIIDASGGTVGDIVDLGKSHAKSIAPYRTGKTARLIMGRVKKTANGFEGSIIARNPTPNKMYGGGTFNLVRWMHATRGVQFGKKHIKSGSPTFMYQTSTWLKGKKISVAKGHFNRINIK